MEKMCFAMRKKFALLLMMLFTVFLASAQEEPETTKPLFDMEVERKVAVLDIEGTNYENVTVRLKSLSPGFSSDDFRVKVKVVDEQGKTIYKKTLKNVFLYVFSKGQVQVGKRNFDQVVIYHSYALSGYAGKIRVKEGVVFL